MSDFDNSCDATLSEAKANIDEGARLIASTMKAIGEREEWEKTNGIDSETRKRFFAALSPQEQKRIAEEQEQFDRELEDDLAAALAAVKKPAGSGEKALGTKTKNRNYA